MNKPHSNNKKKSGINIDSQITLSFFKRNKEKFNPLMKPLKNKQISEDNSTLKGFFFGKLYSLNSLRI